MKQERYDEIAEYVVSALKRNNSIKCNQEIEKVQQYHEGYEQALEDILECIRRGE